MDHFPFINWFDGNFHEFAYVHKQTIKHVFESNQHAFGICYYGYHWTRYLI